MAQRTFNPSLSTTAQLESLSSAVDGLLSDYGGMISVGLKASHDKSLGQMARVGHELIAWAKSFPEDVYTPARLSLLPYLMETTAQAVEMLLVEEVAAATEEMRQVSDRLSALTNRREELRGIAIQTKWDRV